MRLVARATSAGSARQRIERVQYPRKQTADRIDVPYAEWIRDELQITCACRSCRAWRAGDAAQKERIAEAPLLFLRATAQPAAPKLPEGEAGRRVRNLDIAAGALWRAREDLQRAVVADPTTPSNTRVRRAHRLTTAAYEALRGKWEEHDAGSGHASGDLPIAR
jgi:hypothetical protein